MDAATTHYIRIEQLNLTMAGRFLAIIATQRSGGSVADFVCILHIFQSFQDLHVCRSLFFPFVHVQNTVVNEKGGTDYSVLVVDFGFAAK